MSRTGHSRSDTRIDTDLDSSVLIGTAGNPVTTTENLENVQPATYTASDPENDDITWSLEGDDWRQFSILPKTGPMATLAFLNGPDFEEGGREDLNTDNVYEVTIVATDSTLVNHDKLDVTVKVIDSTGRQSAREGVPIEPATGRCQPVDGSPRGPGQTHHGPDLAVVQVGGRDGGLPRYLRYCNN